ncbi:phosphoribosylformylglycinamidine synthase subunit I [Pseudonocardia endophytica]|uniref:Phosphoribosylformylglycinamidine synthase subunit PurQ n=1 Tax=Pseudonocardia endophytica TaxID=401976 RepID=A0A4R1HHG7_PSEEN|nr:phosphoribosylformylglycinamidine synthase subunit I [Pseudonocardia endophytica]
MTDVPPERSGAGSTVVSVRIGVVTFPGSLDDTDAQRAVTRSGAEPVALWHGDSDLAGVDAVVLPGGFSYGDYLRPGAIAGLAPMTSAVVEAARGGMPALGICNGFQILCEAGLLPGALLGNAQGRFVCRPQRLVVERSRSVWTAGLAAGSTITIPIKHMDGRYHAGPDLLAELEANGQVVVRYAPGENPNGSVGDVAGVCSADGRVMGLMPHPEHAIDPLTGPSTDGLALFTSVLQGAPTAAR